VSDLYVTEKHKKRCLYFGKENKRIRSTVLVRREFSVIRSAVSSVTVSRVGQVKTLSYFWSKSKLNCICASKLRMRNFCNSVNICSSVRCLTGWAGPAQCCDWLWSEGPGIWSWRVPDSSRRQRFGCSFSSLCGLNGHFFLLGYSGPSLKLTLSNDDLWNASSSVSSPTMHFTMSCADI
jgi:hypothetical protein